MLLDFETNVMLALTAILTILGIVALVNTDIR
jgi:hypothetical protein